MLSDLIVARDKRGSGVGRALLSWIETQLASEGIAAVFLESGLRNEGAHRFFHREGYRTCSIMMVKSLGSSKI